MASTNPARGMRDFLPADVRKREYVIGIIKSVYESYGFEPQINADDADKNIISNFFRICVVRVYLRLVFPAVELKCE